MRIVVLPGDGIGPEITAATLDVLRVASEGFQLGVEIDQHPIGHQSLRQFGTTVKPGLPETVRSADGLILGPTATFDFKDEASGGINPSKYFRRNLDLFANLRPAKTYPASISLHSSPPGLTGDPVLRGAHGAHNPTGPISGCPACTG